MTSRSRLEAFEFVYNQHVELRLPGWEQATYGRVLDTLSEDLLVRLPDEVAHEAPDEVELGFGHRSWYYRAVVPVRAFYGPCLFLGRPDSARAEKIQRRRFVRIRFRESFYAIGTNVLGEPLDEPFTIALENLSASGCYGVPSRDDGREYLMIMLAVVGMTACYVIGRVIHRRKRSDGTVGLGINFDGIPHGVQDDLARVINEEIRRNLRIGQDITI